MIHSLTWTLLGPKTARGCERQKAGDLGCSQCEAHWFLRQHSEESLRFLWGEPAEEVLWPRATHTTLGLFQVGTPPLRGQWKGTRKMPGVVKQGSSAKYSRMHTFSHADKVHFECNHKGQMKHSLFSGKQPGAGCEYQEIKSETGQGHF